MKITIKDKGKSGIYKILNTINNKFYIGSSISLYRRKITHKSKLKHKKHCNKYLQSSFNKYGEENFEFLILEYCKKEDLYNKEKYWIDYLKPKYNLALNILPIGFKWTKKMKKAQSKRLKGRIFSDEHKEKLKITSKNWIRGKETKLAISNAKKGKRLHSNSLEAARLSIIKPILQYSKNMLFIQDFVSIEDASKLLLINKGNIQSVCCGRRKSAGGFIFKYK